MPVIILMDEIVGHTREKLRLSPRPEVMERQRPKAPPGDLRALSGGGGRITTGRHARLR